MNAEEATLEPKQEENGTATASSSQTQPTSNGVTIKDQPGSSNIDPNKDLRQLPKLRILCLHGYRQNGELFKKKTGAFRKMLNTYAQFIYITAPHLVKNMKENEDDEPVYGWWFNKDDRTFAASNVGGPAIGFEESVKYVEHVWRENGPFDGVMGFSQGACFAGLLLNLQKRGLTPLHFRFGILVSGFLSKSLAHLKYFKEPIIIPSLHVFGDTDEIIPRALSVELMAAFDGSFYPFQIGHSGGHYVPANNTLKPLYVQFLRAIQEQIRAVE